MVQLIGQYHNLLQKAYLDQMNPCFVKLGPVLTVN